MLRYEVTNTREESVTVDGLGVLPPKSTQEFDEVAGENFRLVRGMSLVLAGLPQGVELSVQIVRDGTKES